MAYQVIVNDETTLELNPADIQWDLVATPNGQFHILYKNNSYTATVLETDYPNKTFKIRLGKNIYSLRVKDEFDQLADKLGMGSTTQRKANVIKAPMPGLVLSILVEAGQTVKKGDSVAILEAMKMENVIKAPSDCTIKAVAVTKGNAVEKNQTLLELE